MVISYIILAVRVLLVVYLLASVWPFLLWQHGTILAFLLIFMEFVGAMVSNLIRRVRELEREHGR